MNLRHHHRMNAHGDRIEDLYIFLDDELSRMHQDKPVRNPEQLLMQLIEKSGITDIELPLGNGLDDADLPVGTIKQELHHRHQGFIQTRVELDDDPNAYISDVEAGMLWNLEKKQRGETGDHVTLAYGPFTKRVMAIMGSKLVDENVSPRDLDMPRDHLGILDGLTEQHAAMLAGSFLTAYTRTGNFGTDIGAGASETPDDWEHSWSISNPPEDCMGRPQNYMAVVSNGVCNAIVAVDHRPNEIIYIDDTYATLPMKLPESMMLDRMGKPFDTIYDHPLVRGLDMIVERYVIEEDETKIWFKPWKARTVTVRGMIDA